MLELKPDHPRALMLRAGRLLDQGELKAARADLAILSELGDQHPQGSWALDKLEELDRRAAGSASGG